jgi:hypothetical protein
VSITLDFDENVDEVIEDIEDVQSDLVYNMHTRVDGAMRMVERDTAHYIIGDPQASGQLFSALGYDWWEEDGNPYKSHFQVYLDKAIAPYAAIVEYGSGPRRGIPGPGAHKIHKELGQRPADWPFKAPDIDNISGFAYYIEQWMRAKGLTPELGNYRQASLAIAKTINDQGTYEHPFLRPAWFDNERRVKRAAKRAVKRAVK